MSRKKPQPRVPQPRVPQPKVPESYKIEEEELWWEIDFDYRPEKESL